MKWIDAMIFLSARLPQAFGCHPLPSVDIFATAEWRPTASGDDGGWRRTPSRIFLLDAPNPTSAIHKAIGHREREALPSSLSFFAKLQLGGKWEVKKSVDKL